VVWVAEAESHGGDPVVRMLDQRRLPGKVEFVNLGSATEVSDAIRSMVVRGAPAIGIAGAYGLALEAVHVERGADGLRPDTLDAAYQELLNARPTAVNLQWALDRMRDGMLREWEDTGKVTKEKMLATARAIQEEDQSDNKRMAEYGASLIRAESNVLTHCHTGSIATGGWGTALGVIQTAHCLQGKNIHCWVDETRPRSQGARLTAWELMSLGIPCTLIVDNASGLVMRKKLVDAVFVGADRIAANGDTANKIGTYNVAVLAHEHKIPFYVVAPFSTVDLDTPSGDTIPIEERSAEEVICPTGKDAIAPTDVKVYNPAFDVTPAKFITAIVTERGIVYPPLNEGLQKLAPARS